MRAGGNSSKKPTAAAAALTKTNIHHANATTRVRDVQREASSALTGWPDCLVLPGEREVGGFVVLADEPVRDSVHHCGVGQHPLDALQRVPVLKGTAHQTHSNSTARTQQQQHSKATAQ